MTKACIDALPDVMAGADRLGIRLSTEQQRLLVLYCDLLLETNTQLNLTALREPGQIMRGLALDSVCLNWTLQQTVPAATGHHPRVVDVGSGAGIPGLVLKILNPDWVVTLVESVGKKARFLEQAISALALTETSVLCRRAEDVAWDARYRESSTICVARAVAGLPTLLELCSPLVTPGGFLAFPKGKHTVAEVEEAEPAAKTLRVTLIQVQNIPTAVGLGSDHSVVLYRKSGHTPPGYPRRIGLAKSRPIRSRTARQWRDPTEVGSVDSEPVPRDQLVEEQAPAAGD